MSEQLRFLKKGEKLFERGDPAEGMYVLRQGSIEIYLENKEAKLSLALLMPGGVVGEISLFDNKPRSASAIAASDCELLFINNEKFQNSLERCPKWFANFVGMICTRLRNMNRRLQEIQDAYLFSLNQLRKWTELLHAVDLIYHRSGMHIDKGFSLDRFTLEAELVDMFSMQARKITEFVDMLAEHQILNIYFNGEKDPVIILENQKKLESLLMYLHSSNDDDQSRFCDLEQFSKLLHLFRAKPSKDLFINMLKLDESVDELSQASIDPRKNECRRRYFRILYKSGEYPKFEMPKQTAVVIDISEQGLRFAKTKYDTFLLGDKIEGVVIFPEDQSRIPVYGVVLRITEKDVALELDSTGCIPLQRIMIEQRLLIQRGRTKQLGKEAK